MLGVPKVSVSSYALCSPGLAGETLEPDWHLNRGPKISHMLQGQSSDGDSQYHGFLFCFNIVIVFFPQAMKVLSKKKLLKQYGFPRKCHAFGGYGQTLQAYLLSLLGQNSQGVKQKYFLG